MSNSASRFPDCVPVLSDGVVTLRAHRADDIDRVYRQATDPEMARWTTVPVPYECADAEEFVLQHIPAKWNSGTAMCWVIDVDGLFAGGVDIRGDGPEPEIGYGLHPDQRGRRIMSRAVRLAVAHAFAVGKTRIGWVALDGNLASLRVAHQCGFVLDAWVPGGAIARGEPVDAYRASLRAGDPLHPRTSWESTLADAARMREAHPGPGERTLETQSEYLASRAREHKP
ncbi:GNAT family N-acetyltransferase [Gordonia sp. (in: high G+C Gram-positive bacteria)]|jgi:RimJ/RimL family protein N-acetyltransferase|uniref:GNAT family N-acetyltransferase n=1 Tax=Gordonia sp. (in: high G+C Gram-positive bacteria) TaxID=84139 RepID=UPI001DF0EB85|nr:GNAT family N-acetyltransferase [Gordonia sp. (in: high G+C Gram-positive bacteria)]MCB1295383.1 GNAT family N-acetyltransferase [Gordonia sp. (in: high G+C Gram-positive bacteria)]HMS75377.1 GNAT family N-acetyltransferase [Gordonia sp. (in: high G+C Gram-positive bacteria)]HQV16762.1 GNAT family N-acetyltransferase [Gordonia sp. (in: high G+C Gram-positive bacteria)]